jgi:polysaccharide biosynthesis/export protein
MPLRSFGLLLLLGVLLVSACVPVRKQTYLQERTNELRDYPKDSVIKRFSVEEYTYRLQPGDIISIRITSLTEDQWDFFQKANPTTGGQQDPLLSGYTISPEGTIQLPVVGDVKVSELSLQEANKLLQEVVARYVKSPTVHVKLLNFNYTIVGEVNRQNTYTTYDPKFNILQAVGMAGGLTEFADRANVKIVRQRGDVAEMAFVNLLDDDLLSSPYYYLRPGDMVVVRPLKAKTFNTFTARNITLGISILTALSLFLIRLGN